MTSKAVPERFADSAARPAFALSLFVAATALSVASGPLQAQAIPVKNPSFELPDASSSPTGVSTIINDWQKLPQPAYFDPSVFLLSWNDVTGIFLNAPAGNPRHIENADGNQVGYFFAFPEAGIAQELGASFTTGLSYTLTLGLRGGGTLTEGSQFLAGLQYFDGASWTSAGSVVVSATADYATTQFLQTITVSLPEVQATDAWAGKPIRVVLEAASFSGGSGLAYWEADKIQVQAVPEPGTYALAALAVAGLLGNTWWRRGRSGR